MLLPAQTGSQVDEGRLVLALSQLADTLDKLESMFLRRQPFLCGDDITVADLLAVCELMQVRWSDWSIVSCVSEVLVLSMLRVCRLCSLWRGAETS